MAYYPVIFDQTFIDKLNEFDDSQISGDEKFDYFNITSGPLKNTIETGFDRKIYSIHYLSAKEKILKTKAINNIKNQMHPSIRDWNDNVLTAQQNKLLIRIDTTDKGLRYVSWSKGHKISDKPDLIIFNGVEGEKTDTSGRNYSFVNENWSYVVEYIEPENPDSYSDYEDDQIGWFLRIYHDNRLKSSVKLDEVNEQHY